MITKPHRAVLTIALMLPYTVDGASPQQPPDGTSLKVKIIDESEELLPCRVLVKSERGECFVPQGATTLTTGRDTWFMSPGNVELPVSGGRILLRVEHGLEYVRHKEWIEIPDAGAARTVMLRRWINLKKRGYLAGENHLHVDSRQLASMLVAEGLDFGSSLTWWRGPDARRPVPPGEGRIRLLEYAGRAIPTSIYDAELEYQWGAAYIQNLPSPMPLKAEPGRPNLDYLKHAVQAGAIVHYQGGWSREVLLEALLDCVHTVNVCNNNFALHRFQPRSRYSNLLQVDGFPVYPDTDTGMMRMNTDTYYRLLNCGLKLAAGAGSATGVKQAPVGYNRAYVRVPSGATIDHFYEAWRRGENFVTNGPVVLLSTLSGHRPGSTIELPVEGGSIDVCLEVLSNQPLRLVEIVVNGQVAATIDLVDAHRVEATRELRLKTGSWIAARCTARDDLLTDDELAAYAGKGTEVPFGVAPSRLRLAHTSPIYITVGDRGAAVRQSVQEGLQMLHSFQTFAAEQADPAYRESIMLAVDEARRSLK